MPQQYEDTLTDEEMQRVIERAQTEQDQLRATEYRTPGKLRSFIAVLLRSNRELLATIAQVS